MVSALPSARVEQSRVRVVAGDILVCCGLGQDTFLSQCLSPPTCINGYTGDLNAGAQPWDGLVSHPGGVEMLLVVSRYRNRDKLRPDGPLGWYVDFYLHHALSALTL